MKSARVHSHSIYPPHGANVYFSIYTLYSERRAGYAITRLSNSDVGWSLLVLWGKKGGNYRGFR